MGPTASGKTAIAIELSRLIPAEIISCDSMQVYRGMPILTQALVVHSKVPEGSDPSDPKRCQRGLTPLTHLVSTLDPSEEYSAAKFREEAGKLIPKILKKGKTPVIAGGTGLYLRALLDGLFESPEGESVRDEAFRKKLVREQEKHGGDYLHRKLAAADPLSANKIHPNDIRRLVRALEVFHLSGKPMSVQKANRAGIRDQYDVRIFLLDRERSELYERINQRVELMMKEGLLEEVKRLRKKKLSLTAGVALGFREMSAYLEGTVTLEAAVELLKKNTRHYAKRQLSWFRHEKGVEIVPVKEKDTAKKIAGEILRKIK